MDVLKFSKRQSVTWFKGDREIGETTFLPNEEINCEILCREENLPKHQYDPIYIYTIRNFRGQTGVVFVYLNQPVQVRKGEIAVAV
jgi:hypothetical protein